MVTIVSANSDEDQWRPARLGTVAKAGQVLELFTPDSPEWGVSEAAHELGLPRSSVHEMLSSLEAINLLQKTPTSRYRLGWRLVRMAAGVTDATLLKQVTPGVLGSLAEQTGQGVYLAVWEGDEVLYVSRSLGRRGQKLDLATPGTVLPANAAASGKMLLAGMADARAVERALARATTTLTPKTSTDPARLRSEVQRARKRGVALSREEVLSGIGSLAVPVLGEEGRTVAVVGVALEARGLPRFLDEHLRTVRRASSTITALMRQQLRDRV